MDCNRIRDMRCYGSSKGCLSGEILLARTLLSATTQDLATVLKQVKQTLPVPIVGVISDGQVSIRKAVATALPEATHGLCHFHYLRWSAKFVYEADRHAKKELKKRVRGVREIERAAAQPNESLTLSCSRLLSSRACCFD